MMEYGLKIPIIPGGAGTAAFTTQAAGAYVGVGYSGKAVSGTTINIPALVGKQTFSGTKNTFSRTRPSGATAGLDAEGFPNQDAFAVVVTNNKSIDTLSGLGVAKNIVGDSVYNAVWNDLVDCIPVPDDTELDFGYCYCFDGEKYYKSSKYLEDGIIGIHSDTAGFCMGDKPNTKQLLAAVAGFALVHVDKEYPVGTPLTCGENGFLTEMKKEDIPTNSHKIVGTFWKKEWSSWWGFTNPTSDKQVVSVNDRMWIKVR